MKKKLDQEEIFEKGFKTNIFNILIKLHLIDQENLNICNIPEKTIDRFWDKVKEPENSKDCWIWTGSLKNNKYGKILVNKIEKCAHIFAYEYVFGPVPEGKNLYHICKNPLCVNPFHITFIKKIGGKKIQCKNNIIGCKNKNAKLIEYEVMEMLNLIYQGKFNSPLEIQNKYNISNYTLQSILNGNSWKHVTDQSKIPLSLIRKKYEDICNVKKSLSDDDVIKILNGIWNNEFTSIKQIAKKFKTYESIIREMLMGNNYKSVTDRSLIPLERIYEKIKT